MDTLGRLAERNARLYADDDAIISDGRRVSYGALLRRSRQLASALQNLGVMRQDRVSILAMNCPEYCEVYCACHLSGHIVSTINYRLTAPEISFILQEVAPIVLIFEAQYTEIVAAIRSVASSLRSFVCIGEGPEWAIPYEALLETGSPEGATMRSTSQDVAHLMYSSGTTGQPKGVMKSHRAELARGEIFAAQLRLESNQRSLVMMPLFHTGATSILLAAQWIGSAVILHRKFDAAAILRDIEQEQVAMTHMAPTIIRAILDSPEIERRDLSSLKTLFYASAPMPVALLRRALARFGPILANGYGTTEGGGTFLQKHYHKPDGTPEERRRLYSIGHPTAHAEIKILDEQGRESPTGSAGELVIKSPTVMDGYWNNSVATREALRDGWLHTGDIGYVDDEGFVYLVDRKKDMIISGGENIYCQEVEQVLMNHGSVAEAAVIGVPDERWGEVAKAFVIAADSAKLSAAELTEYASQHLARYKLPKSFVFVEDLPRLASGKVNKRALRST